MSGPELKFETLQVRSVPDANHKSIMSSAIGAIPNETPPRASYTHDCLLIVNKPWYT